MPSAFFVKFVPDVIGKKIDLNNERNGCHSVSCVNNNNNNNNNNCNGPKHEREADHERGMDLVEHDMDLTEHAIRTCALTLLETIWT